MHDVFEQVKIKVFPFIKHYMSDLMVHDKSTIEGMPDIDFLHLTRESGTHMFMFTPEDSYPSKCSRIPYYRGTADRYFILKDICSRIPYMLKTMDILLILHKTDEGIREIKGAEAEALVKDYENKILNSWTSE